MSCQIRIGINPPGPRGDFPPGRQWLPSGGQKPQAATFLLGTVCLFFVGMISSFLFFQINFAHVCFFFNKNRSMLESFVFSCWVTLILFTIFCMIFVQLFKIFQAHLNYARSLGTSPRWEQAEPFMIVH